MAQRVVIHWNLASFIGCGNFGLNLALHSAHDPRIEAVTSFPVIREHAVTDALRLGALESFFARSLAFQAELKERYGRRRVPSSVLVAASSRAFDRRLEGTPPSPSCSCEGEIERDGLDALQRLPLTSPDRNGTDSSGRASRTGL